MRTPLLPALISDAPPVPGIYCLLDNAQALLYVGKAGSLRHRLAQHAKAASAGAHHARLDTLYARTTHVRWVETTDEEAAACLEADIIVALQPPFNAGIVKEGRWAYITVSEVNNKSRFHLTADPGPAAADRPAPVYGCFPHLGRGVSSRPGIACNDGYAALLRALWSVSGQPGPMPAKITRPSAPDSVDIAIDDDLKPALHACLSGAGDRIFPGLARRIEGVEPYLRPGLTRDLALANDFYTHGPRAIRALRLRHKIRATPLHSTQFRSLVANELHAAIGDFTLPATEPLPDRRFPGRMRRWRRTQPPARDLP